MTDALGSLRTHFAALDDPRVERTKLHGLLDIVVIALCAVLGGASSWDDIALFGETKQDWFATFLALPHGIPSHDTFNRVFAALDPAQFEQAFRSWVAAVSGALAPQLLACDGKNTARLARCLCGHRSLAFGQCLGEHRPPSLGASRGRRQVQ